jgi:hypothetical protein
MKVKNNFEFIFFLIFLIEMPLKKY